MKTRPDVLAQSLPLGEISRKIAFQYILDYNISLYLEYISSKTYNFYKGL